MFFIFFDLVFTKPSTGQSFLNLEGAQTFSTFKFSSNASTDNATSSSNQNYTRITGNAFSLVFQQVNPNGLYEVIGIGLRQSGSELVFKNVDYIWNMQYADFRAGLGYQFNKWRIKPFGSFAPYYAYLMDGKQSMGLLKYDIKMNKAIKNFDLGFFFSLGFKIAISKQISIFSEYNYVLGLKNIETTKDQSLQNRGFSIRLGLSLNITPTKESKVPIELNIKDTTKHISEIASVPNNDNQESFPEITPLHTPVSERIADTIRGDDKKGAGIAKAKEKINDLDDDSKGNPDPDKSSVNKEESPKITHVEIASSLIASYNNGKPAQKSDSEIPSKEVESTKVNASVNKEKPTKKKNFETPLEEIKSKKSSTTTKHMPDKVVFKIQIGTASKPLGINHPLLKNLTGRIEKQMGKDGMIRYYSGTFESYDEARAFLGIIKSKGGNEGAFVTAFNNGKQITVYEAKKLLEEK